MNIRRFILPVILIFSVYGTLHAQPSDGLWDRANTAYINSAYDKALQGYDSIMNSGYSSYKLYYNMGNAHFKNGEIGKSILNYNKALRRAPSDSDIKHNLGIANAYVKDKIEVMPEFFLYSWVRGLRLSLGPDTWAAASLLFFAIAIVGAFMYMLSGKLAARKAGFYVAAITLAAFALSLGFSLRSRSELANPSEAIVMSSAAPVKSSPDSMSKDIFILHEGTKVKVLGNLNQWKEIQIADGNKGWILESSIEIID